MSALETRFDTDALLDFLFEQRGPRRSFFECGLTYAERICLERWVSGADPVFVYGPGRRLRGLAIAGGDGSLVVHAPPTDKFYTQSSTGYPPDWDFYRRPSRR